MAKSKKSNLKSSEFSAQSSEQKSVSQTNKKPIKIGEQIRNTLIYEWQNEKLLYLFLIIHFVSLYAFSFYSDGFYQGEEGAHYINMKMFWENPSVILGNWAKTGWKLLYIFPVLGGKTLVFLMNCFWATLTAFFTYKIVKNRGSEIALLVIPLMMSSILWFGVSFRNYSEISAACMIMAAVYFHFKSNDLWAAFFISFGLIIRQELYLPAFLFGAYLLYRMNFRAIAMLALFPLLNNFWGFVETGDLMYLYSDAKKTATQYSSQYLRAGFDHYFLMSGVCFGYLTVIGILLYLVMLIRKIRKPEWFVLIPFYIFFLTDCLFNLKSYPIGTSTAGNLRYMLIILPLGVAMAVWALGDFYKLKKKYLYLILFVPVLTAVAYFFTFDHNWIERAFWAPRIYTPLYVSIALIVVMMIPRISVKIYQWSLIALCAVNVYLFTNPIQLANRDENSTCKEIVDWVNQNKYIHSRHIYQQLSMFTYFMDMTPSEFKYGLDNVTVPLMEQSKVGSIVIWDSHFAERYGGVNYKYFEDRPDKFLILKQWQSPDQKVVFAAFERINY